VLVMFDAPVAGCLVGATVGVELVGELVGLTVGSDVGCAVGEKNVNINPIRSTGRVIRHSVVTMHQNLSGWHSGRSSEHCWVPGLASWGSRSQCLGCRWQDGLT
jgi:hypothetical protein